MNWPRATIYYCYSMGAGAKTPYLLYGDLLRQGNSRQSQTTGLWSCREETLPTIKCNEQSHKKYIYIDRFSEHALYATGTEKGRPS